MADDTTTGGMPEANNGTFEAWLEGQSDEVKTRFEEQTQGLRSALKSERENVKTLSNQLNELKDAAEKGSALEQQITALQDKLRESERHANFIDGAAGAGCTNAKAAYKLAKADADLWKRDGTPDWAAIKETAPEFFQKPVKAAGNAGSGTNTNPNTGGKMHPMDELMRRSIGIL